MTTPAQHSDRDDSEARPQTVMEGRLRIRDTTGFVFNGEWRQITAQELAETIDALHFGELSYLTLTLEDASLVTLNLMHVVAIAGQTREVTR